MPKVIKQNSKAAERGAEITTSQQEEQKLGRQHLKQERESTKKAVHPTQEPI
jgi:hypothetical protein